MSAAPYPTPVGAPYPPDGSDLPNGSEVAGELGSWRVGKEHPADPGGLGQAKVGQARARLCSQHLKIVWCLTGARL